MLGLAALLAAAPPAMAEPEKARNIEEAVFAGGCFWCVEHAFDELPGVIETTSGYTGGHTPNPDYASVSSGRTGHVEAVRVRYDPEKVRYEDLLEHFWRNIDPTQADGQFCDIGSQYRSVIFVRDERQRRAAEASLKALARAHPDWKIATQIEPLGPFYPAEAEHQDFHERNPVRYYFYRYGCGRDRRLAELWGRK